MSQPVVIQFQWTLQQFMAATLAARDAKMRPPFQWCILSMGVLAAIIGPIGLAWRGFDPFGLFITFYGIYMVGKWLATPWKLKRTFLRSDYANRVVRMTFDTAAIQYDVEGLLSSSLQWKMFTDLLPAKHGYLLRNYDGSLSVWIPYSALQSEEESRHLLSVVRERIAAAASQTSPPTS